MKYENKDVIIITISDDDPDILADFMKKNNYTFRVLLDPKGEVSKKYEIVGIPTTFFINTLGKITNKDVGAMAYKSFKSRIEGLK